MNKTSIMQSVLFFGFALALHTAIATDGQEERSNPVLNDISLKPMTALPDFEDWSSSEQKISVSVQKAVFSAVQEAFSDDHVQEAVFSAVQEAVQEAFSDDNVQKAVFSAIQEAFFSAVQEAVQEAFSDDNVQKAVFSAIQEAFSEALAFSEAFSDDNVQKAVFSAIQEAFSEALAFSEAFSDDNVQKAVKAVLQLLMDMDKLMKHELKKLENLEIKKPAGSNGWSLSPNRLISLVSIILGSFLTDF